MSAPDTVASVLRYLLEQFVLTTVYAWGWLVYLTGPLREEAGRLFGVPVDYRAAIFLITGGLATLAILFLVLLLRGTLFGVANPLPAASAVSRRVLTGPRDLPGLRAADDTARGGSRAPPEDEFERGRVVGARVGAADVDELLDRVAETGMADPRILRNLPNLTLVRLYRCGGCRSETGPGPETGCPFEVGFLEAAFERLLGRRVVAREVACHRSPGSACDVEVWS
ncbi:MAG: 4-vinyl reductase [Methanobacteriota archaeon]